jgi:hypothetical protein
MGGWNFVSGGSLANSLSLAASERASGANSTRGSASSGMPPVFEAMKGVWLMMHSMTV